ncbi:hypothetical protein [Mucilaginibacter sp. UR6-11]|uniref:hypothetical protein n=1 Tax=Mucilaginibacter sp. UR6-11 TaxID=1435644 RepID=UPI00351D9FFB
MLSKNTKFFRISHLLFGFLLHEQFAAISRAHAPQKPGRLCGPETPGGPGCGTAQGH